MSVRFAALLMAFAMLAPQWTQASDAVLPLSALPRERIAVETRSARRHLFEAWRAETPEARAQGLMFVQNLRPEQAMIFVYEAPQPVTMWMKNTLIPLDMLFVDEGGCVVKVHERARPGDLTGIGGGAPVVLVLELAGGTVATLGLAEGDRVVRPDAGWPRAPRPCTRSR
ncbi:MAG: DUF192 domain-containing protein [Steroidobacteraceae bacterium]|nr:DUF192 domain-containing protein [Steroidobacteraceae bacterium]